MSLLFSHDAVTGKGIGTDATEASAERKLSATLGGDVTIAGTHIYVDKSVPFDKAKAEVEKFARENGASVVKAYKAGFKDFWGFDLSKRIAEDAAFLAGEKVKFIKGELNGKVGEYVRELGVGTHIVKVDGVERRCSSGEFRVYSTALGDSAEAEDAADLRVKRIPLTGKWCVEPNISMFGGGAERLGAERKHFETREDAEKYAKGTGKTYRVVDSAAFPMSEKASRIVKGIIPQIERIRSEVHSAIVDTERDPRGGEKRNALYRDLNGLDKILDALEDAVSFA